MYQLTDPQGPTTSRLVRIVTGDTISRGKLEQSASRMKGSGESPFHLGLLLSLFMTSCIATVTPQPSRVFKIGVIIDRSMAASHTRILDLARDYVNTRGDVLLPNTTVEMVVRVQENSADRFESLQLLCQILEENVIAIIGPTRSSTVKAVQPICAGLHIPHVAPVATDPSFTVNHQDYPFLLKMAPPDNFQSQALFDLVRSFGWSHMALLLSNSDYGRNGLQYYIELAVANNWVLTRIEYIHVGKNEVIDRGDIRTKLELIRASGVRVILLNCWIDCAWMTVTVARSLNMFEAGWVWIVSDGVTMNAEPVRTNTSEICLTEYAGLLGTSPIHGVGPLAKNFQKYSGVYHIDDMGNALIDSMLVVAYGLNAYLESGKPISSPNFPIAVCSSGRVTPWQYGESLFEYMRQVDEDGVMGRINFTIDNSPVDISYSILNMRRDDWNQIGVWKNGLLDVNYNDVIFPGETTKVPTDQNLDIADMTFRVVTIMETPFVMKDNGTTEFRETEPQLQGFCIDVFNKLQEYLNFKYQLHLVKDGKYGNKNPDGSWNGIMAEVINGEADIGLSAMFITADRQEVLDWTTPYLDLGLDVLIATEQEEWGVFDFLRPFDLTTWLCLLGATCLSGLAVSLCSTLSPWGMRGRYIQRRDKTNQKYKVDKSTLNISNGIWFAVSSLLKQGPERSPTSLSGRLVAAVWWGVVTIILATYTANLTALLTVEKLNTVISSLEDLASQSDVHYGTVEFTAIQDYFGTASLTPIPKMYRAMEDWDSWVANSEVGIESVRNSASSKSRRKYAFIYDSTVLEHAARNPPCVTRTLGHLFRKQGYGIALPKNSPYTTILSTAILDMRERGDMQMLYNKWITGSCDEEEAAKTESEQITIERTAGSFYLCLGAVLVALFLVLLECCLASYGDVLAENPDEGQTKGWCYHLGRRFYETRQELIQTVCFCCRRRGPNSSQKPQPDTLQDHDMRDQPQRAKKRKISIIHDPNWSLQPDLRVESISEYNYSPETREKVKHKAAYPKEEHVLYMWRK